MNYLLENYVVKHNFLKKISIFEKQTAKKHRLLIILSDGWEMPQTSFFCTLIALSLCRQFITYHADGRTCRKEYG